MVKLKFSHLELVWKNCVNASGFDLLHFPHFQISHLTNIYIVKSLMDFFFKLWTESYKDMSTEINLYIFFLLLYIYHVNWFVSYSWILGYFLQEWKNQGSKMNFWMYKASSRRWTLPSIALFVLQGIVRIIFPVSPAIQFCVTDSLTSLLKLSGSSRELFLFYFPQCVRGRRYSKYDKMKIRYRIFCIPTYD